MRHRRLGHYAAALLTLLWLQIPSTVAAEGDPPETWAEFDDAFRQLAQDASFLAAEVTDGQCVPVHELDADRTLAIGSSFKLYILGELAHQLRDHRFRSNTHGHWRHGRWRLGPWSQPVAIEQRYKAIPHGPLLWAPDGTLLTVRYFAEKMIQDSDNTATDHLLFLLGRENVERRMRKMGHHDPSLNIPLFATREMAIMKYLWTDEQVDAYEAASVPERRRLLAQEDRHNEDIDELPDQVAPLRIDTAEWFANRFDMCQALIELYELGQDPRLRPVLEALTLADQIGVDRERFPYVGFKGGSEIGVFAGNWLLVRNDGRRFVMSFALSDSTRGLDPLAVVDTLQPAANVLLYETP
jgi:hypothetical protein